MDGEQLFCYSQEPYDLARDMVECKDCAGWFHPACVHLEGQHLAHVMNDNEAVWACPACLGGNGADVGVGAAAPRTHSTGNISSGLGDTAAAGPAPKKRRIR